VKTLLRPEMRDFDPDERTSFLEAVDRQSERLRALIEDLLVVARLDAHEVVPILTPVHIADVVDRVVTELRDPLAQHPLSVEMDPELPRIQSDEGKIQQILTNLIDNACKYTPDGSDIVVRVHPEGEGITISVVDTGAGIPPEQQDLVFDRFYQVDQSSTRKAGGTGLGLYLCRRLSEALGGRIWLERSDATGSTFSLWVPAAVTPHEGARAAESVN
jgi:two-component system phosphate regulon sensor histidine kinase PhoR